MTIKSKKNLGKKELISNIKSNFGLSSSNIQKISEDIIEVIVDILSENKKINIKNFGSLNVIFKKQREGRNPKTKENFIITSRNTIKFKISNTLKSKINQF